jgi:hypothetical protein
MQILRKEFVKQFEMVMTLKESEEYYKLLKLKDRTCLFDVTTYFRTQKTHF